MENQHKFSIWYVLLGIWVVLIIQSYIASMFAYQVIPYSQFLSMLKEGKITEVAVTANQIEGKMKIEGTTSGETKGFRTIRVDPDLSKLLDQYKITFKGEIESTFLRDILSWVLPILLFVGTTANSTEANSKSSPSALYSSNSSQFTRRPLPVSMRCT